MQIGRAQAAAVERGQDGDDIEPDENAVGVGVQVAGKVAIGVPMVGTITSAI